MIDLHTHSTASDGSMTPAELVRHAKASGMEAIALSDHDSVDGVKEAVSEGRRIGLEVVPSIEFSVESATETHILGYYIDIENQHMLDAFSKIRKARMERNYEYSEKLGKLGFDVSVEEAAALASGGIIARAHFAKVMVAKGYAVSVKQAFDDYLSNGKPAYSSKQAITASEAVDIITKAGGVAYVAHLHLIRKSIDGLRTFLSELKEAGLTGIEGYYTDYTPELQHDYQALANELGLGISGGTDFHGAMKPHISIGKGLGSMNIPYSVLADIKERLKSKQQNN